MILKISNNFFRKTPKSNTEYIKKCKKSNTFIWEVTKSNTGYLNEFKKSNTFGCWYYFVF